MPDGQCRLGRRRTGPGPAGGARRRPPRHRGRADVEHGLRIRPAGRDAGRAGHSSRGRERRGGRRHGVHVEHAVRAAPHARRRPDGERRDPRPDDPRRPVVRVRALAHGQQRRGRRQRVSRVARGSGPLRRRESPSRRGRHRRRLVPRRNRAHHDPAEEGRSDSRRQRRTHPRRHDRRGPREVEARVQEGRNRHGRERARRERRRRGARDFVRGVGGRTRQASARAHRRAVRQRAAHRSTC